MCVPYEIHGGGLDGRNRYCPARCIEALHGNGSHLLSRDERDPDGPTLDGPLALLDHYLKLLGPVVGRTVVLGGRQETRVVSSFPPLHQRRNELIRRKTPEPFIFGWHDDVEPARGTGHKPAFRQTIQSQFCGIPRHTQRFAHLFGCEVVAAAGR